MNAQKPDRHELQANGKHPAPCAKFCEATAFTIELRRAQAEVVRLRVIAKEAAEYATEHQTEVLRLQAQLAAAQGQEPVDAVPLSDMVEGSHPSYGRGLFATDNCVKQFYAASIPQPPAPSEIAITYMTGYSDGREWAGATSQAQPERAPLTDAEIEQAVKTHGVCWTGYREDKHGFYTIPILMPYHYQFARAIEAAHGIGTEVVLWRMES